jgi:hypothetical protein
MMKLRFPLMTTGASATDRVAFAGIGNPLSIYTAGLAITYENTTLDFAAAVMASDSQGFRVLYHSLTSDTREIGIVPWKLESGGRYVLKYGPDADEDETMDSVLETREFHFPQAGMPIRITVAPRLTYIVEVDQLERGRGASMAPDPGLSPEDIRYAELRVGGYILARIHNVGSKPVRGVKVAAYDGDPKAGGVLIGTSVIPNIEPPNDLEPRTVTVGFKWTPSEELHEIYIVVDPDDEMAEEITTFNNVAHATLPKEEEAPPVKKKQVGFGSGRR